ncbi:MAG: hypothetical protein RL216_991 [Pseudomonadota bacterium]|jgi:uncharacterized membrane protein
MAKPPLPSPAARVPQLPQDLEAVVGRTLEGKVAKRDLPDVARQITQLIASEQFSGPLPHPKHLRDYEAALPGAAERILAMAELNLASSVKLNADTLAAETLDRRRGMYLGAGLFALLILCGFASLFVTDNPVVPGLFLGAAAIGGITSFIRGRSS